MGFQVVFKFNTWKAIGMDEIHIFGVSVWRLMSREEFPFFFFLSYARADSQYNKIMGQRTRLPNPGRRQSSSTLSSAKIFCA